MDVIGELAAASARFFLAFVFLQAGFGKLWAMADFRHAVARYDLLPSRLVPIFAGALPRIEVAAGFALLVGVGTRAAAALVAALLLTFSTAIAANLAQGRTIECGCSSATAPEQIGWSLVARNLSLVSLAGFVAIQEPSAIAVDGLWRGESAASSGDAIAMFITTAVAFLGWTLTKGAWRFREAVGRYSSEELGP